MNVAIVGTGYVGLVTGVCLAERGNQVQCVDNNPTVVERLRGGGVTIYEPGLEEIYQRNLRKGRIEFSPGLEAAVLKAQVIFLCLPTPPGEDGSADLRYVLQVADEIGKILASHPGSGYKVIVDKSTVPVGTSEKVEAAIRRHVADQADIDVVSNPEFLREGSAIEDTLRPDRIVIGAPNQQVAMTLVELYAPLERPMIITDLPSAEVIKYASNAFLAAKISFINAIANICEAAGADVSQVMKGMGLDSRIGMQFLQAGLGYGGSCFPKDVDSLIHTASQLGYDFKLLRSVVEINKERAAHLVEMMRKAIGPLEDKTIAVPVEPGKLVARVHARLDSSIGAITVESEPAGASVVVDDRPAGTTPLTIRELRLDRRHRIDLVLAGYEIDQFVVLPEKDGQRFVRRLSRGDGKGKRAGTP